jgi:hypothetical protein
MVLLSITELPDAMIGGDPYVRRRIQVFHDDPAIITEYTAYVSRFKTERHDNYSDFKQIREGVTQLATSLGHAIEILDMNVDI